MVCIITILEIVRSHWYRQCKKMKKDTASAIYKTLKSLETFMRRSDTRRQETLKTSSPRISSWTVPWLRVISLELTKFFLSKHGCLFHKFFSSSDINRSHGTVQDDILGDDVFKVSCRQVSDLCVKVSSLFSVFNLTLTVSFFVLLYCLHQCYLTISSIVVMQTIFVH